MNTVQCPVCTLYLREGITLKEHLDTHPKDKVIEALVSSSQEKAANVVNQSNFQNSYIQSPFQINNHVPNPMQFSIIQPNPEQIQTAQGVFLQNVLPNRRYIVSHPGTIIKVPQQILGPPHYGSPQLQIPARPAQPHILTSNTQNINTQGGPAIIYSQLPQPVQNVPNVQQNDHFQSIQSFEVPQQPNHQTTGVVPHSSSISTSITSNNGFCTNSPLQQFNNLTNSMQSNKSLDSEIPLKNTPVQGGSNTQEYCNASTQVSTVAIINSDTNTNDLCLVEEQYHDKLYEVKDDMDSNEQYEYFDENPVCELDLHYNSQSEETENKMKEEPEYFEDDKSNIDSSADCDVDNLFHDEHSKEIEHHCSEDNLNLSTCNEMESAIVNLDNMNTITDQIDYDDYSSNDFDDGLENLGDNDGILIEAKIDIDENDVTLDSANDREQIKEIDLSKSNLNNGIKRHISYVQNKNRIIIPFVTQNTCNNDQQTLYKGNPMSKQHITNNGIMRESKAKKWFEDKSKDSISQVTHNTHHNINVVCSPRNLEDEQKAFNDSVVKESEGPTIVQMENENEAHISKFKKNTLHSSHKAVPMVLENKQKNPNNVVETEEQKSKQIGTEVSISQVRYNTNHNTREVSSPMNLESKQKISKKSTVMELEEPKTKRFENKVTILQIKHKTHHNTHAGPSHMDLGSKQKVFNERIIVASEKSRGKQIENSNKVSISPARHNAHHDTREVSCPMELESKRKVFHDRIDIELEESRANQIENKKEVSVSHVRQSNHHNDHEASNQRLSEMNPKSIIGSIVMNSEESRTKHKNEISISPVIHKTHHNTREVPVQMDLENKRKILNDSAVMELGEPRTKQIENKNEISISQVRQHNTHHNTHGVSSQMDSESKRKIDSIIIESEEPKSKKHKQENKPCSNKVVMNLKPSSYSVPVEGNISYEIQEVMYEMKAFGNVKLSVHKLHIPTIKNETSEECSKMQSSTNIYDYKTPMPSTSSTPDVGVLLSEIKTEPGVVSKPITVNKVPKVEDTIPTSTSNFLDYNAAQRGKQRKTVKILKIKNAKTREQPDGAQMNTSSSSQQAQSSVIQHPVKTEPPPPYDTKHGILYCQPGSSKTSATNPEPPKNSAGNFLGIDLPSVSNLPQLDRPPTVDITPSKYLPTNLNSPSLESPIQDYNFLVANTKLDRLSNLHNGEYDSVDTPHWLLRGINILPQVIEDDRISCASPKTLLNLDHQTSFEPDDSGSTSINMQTDEMMPPRGELSGQESLESSVWGYQEDNGAPQYHRQWDEMDHEVMANISNSNSFRTKIEKIEPINSLPDNIKIEESVSILPVISSLDIAKKKKHACIYCKKTFTGWKLRKYHMKAEHPELFNEPETIKLLSKTQASTSTVISEPSTSFVSQAVCPIKFENSNSFGTQIQEFLPPSLTSIKNKQRRCDTCSEVFDKLKDYQEHIKNVHPLPCPVCSKTFPSKPSLTLHMRTHLKIKPYKCDVCDKSFVTAQKLSDHKNTHTGNAPFPCNMCDRHFKRYSNLAQHKKVIHLKKKKIKDFYCHCGEIFQSRGKLLWHQETHATVPKQCTYCTEKFTHTSSLTRHIRKNHDPRYLPVDRKKTDENVNCDICKIVVLKSTLKSHMRIHDNAKPFSCTVCKKSFYTKWNLGLHQWTHVSRMHMPFKCKSCNRGFYSSSEYQAHLRSHRNIRPFTCNYCGRKFIRKFNCIRHVREHELKKKYSCTICGKTFHRSYYLTAHVRVHNGERPFSCHICGKTSTTKSNHNKHVKTHHARETINTEG